MPLKIITSFLVLIRKPIDGFNVFDYIKTLLVFGIVSVMVAPSLAQSNPTQPEFTLPKVFVIGDFQKSYEKLFSEYPDILITACDGNLDSAQTAWLSYVTALESYSKEVGFDLEGVSMWIHFFWTIDGKVAHVAYHLQPHSRFIKDDAMLAFLRAFTREHKIQISASRAFNHYGSASFPLYYYNPSRTEEPTNTKE